jgi:hypothetical protein
MLQQRNDAIRNVTIDLKLVERILKPVVVYPGIEVCYIADKDMTRTLSVLQRVLLECHPPAVLKQSMRDGIGRETVREHFVALEARCLNPIPDCNNEAK